MIHGKRFKEKNYPTRSGGNRTENIHQHNTFHYKLYTLKPLHPTQYTASRETRDTKLMVLGYG